MFLLEDGPRKGQLVDELPAGYRVVEHEPGGFVTLFDDYTAQRAVWSRPE